MGYTITQFSKLMLDTTGRNGMSSLWSFINPYNLKEIGFIAFNLYTTIYYILLNEFTSFHNRFELCWVVAVPAVGKLLFGMQVDKLRCKLIITLFPLFLSCRCCCGFLDWIKPHSFRCSIPYCMCAIPATASLVMRST